MIDEVILASPRTQFQIKAPTISKTPELLRKPLIAPPEPTNAPPAKLTMEEKKMSILDKIAKEALQRPATRG